MMRCYGFQRDLKQGEMRRVKVHRLEWLVPHKEHHEHQRHELRQASNTSNAFLSVTMSGSQ
jgi:hypothetical protein